jgi:tetratricopeptide (TPR) repeat protein
MILEALFFVVIIVFFYRTLQTAGPGRATAVVPPKQVNPRLAQLEEYADRLYGQQKYLTAERAYLEVLKVDHKNLKAYNRLGMIYANLRNYPDAIECFQIVSQRQPSAAHLTSLATAYLENKNPIKAIATFEKAIMFEPSASRYLGLAKAYQRLANPTRAAQALERAVAMDPRPRYLHLLAEAQVKQGDRPAAKATYARILELDPTDIKAKQTYALLD